MKLILHAGAHVTDNDRLIKGLLRNREGFAKQGIAIPAPRRYRALLRDTLNALSQGKPAPDADVMFWDDVLDQDLSAVSRVVLSNTDFFGPPQIAIEGNILYPTAERHIAALASLFEGYDLEICLAIRNPATWLNDLYGSSGAQSFSTFLPQTDPMQLPWSHLFARLQRAFPQIKFTLWCDEDTPVLWGGIMRRMAGLPPGTRITGAFDMLANVITQDGYRQFRTYLKARANLNHEQRMRAALAFLRKYAKSEAIEQEITIPEWDENTVTALTTLYEDDLGQISQIDGVRLLAL